MKNKIAFISEHASPLATLGGVDSGGQNVYVAELARNLARTGYEIDIYTRWEDENLEQVVYWQPGIRIINVKAGPVKYIAKEELLEFMPEFAYSMMGFIEDEKLDYQLVHANFFMSGWVACQLKAILEIPFVITFHALGHVRRLHQKEADRFPACRIEIEEAIVRSADRIIAECPQDKDDLIQFYKAPEKKISIVPCGFSKNEFFPVDKLQARKILGLNANENVILQLGRMVPRKGVDNVIQALSKLPDAVGKVRLLIVGGDTEGADRKELERLKQIAEHQNVTDNVTFVGSQDRQMLKYYYSAADIFISTPWYEPFGITPLEAMACGTPVIGSDVGGIKYSVTDGETGYLVPPKNPQALADKIGFLLLNRSLLNEMRQNAMHRANTQFTWQKIAEMVAGLYNSIQTFHKTDVMFNQTKAA